MQQKPKTLSSFAFLDKIFPSMVGKLIYVPMFEYPIELVAGLEKYRLIGDQLVSVWDWAVDTNTEDTYRIPRGTPMVLLDYKLNQRNNKLFYQVLIQKEICWVLAEYTKSKPDGHNREK